MGLLDIWKDWRSGAYSPKGYEWGSQETDVDIGSSFPARTDLNTAGGTSVNMDRRIPRKRGEVPINPKYVREKSQVRDRLGRVIEPGSQLPSSEGGFQTRFKKQVTLPDGSKQWMGPNEMVQKGLTESAAKSPDKTPFDPSQGDLKYHGNEQEQLKWWETLANKVGFDPDKAAATWKQKGGFEGLMANPAFTMGLAFLSAGAEGKNIGQGALDNVMKAAGISSHYKKILKDREEAPIEVTATDVGEVKSLLNTMNISDPSNIEKFWGKITGKGNVQMKFDLAAEEVAVELQKEIKKLKKNKKPGDPEVVYDTNMKLKILKRMFDEGRFKKKGGTWFTDATLETTTNIPKFDNRAQGGPVQAGKPYIVGEKGPEVIIPKSDGNVLANDDSQIFAMLLASNPQLQNVSRQRAEKILRSRFPEYFEV